MSRIEGALPELPEELEGVDYKIEYVSVMAQAQKLAGIGNIERLVSFTGNLAGIAPEALMKLDIEGIVQSYADKVGVEPELLKTKDEMEAIRAQQQAQQQAAMEQEQAMQQAQMSKTLSETSMDEDTALQQVLGQA